MCEGSVGVRIKIARFLPRAAALKLDPLQLRAARVEAGATEIQEMRVSQRDPCALDACPSQVRYLSAKPQYVRAAPVLLSMITLATMRSNSSRFRPHSSTSYLIQRSSVSDIVAPL